MNGRLSIFGVMILFLLIGYGLWLHLTSGARAFGRAAAVVVVSEGRADCTIIRTDNRVRREVPCRDISAHLGEDFQLGPGVSVGIRAMGKVTSDTVAGISYVLRAHGYKVAGIMRVRFSSEPTGAR